MLGKWNEKDAISVCHKHAWQGKKSWVPLPSGTQIFSLSHAHDNWNNIFLDIIMNIKSPALQSHNLWSNFSIISRS